MGPMYYIGLDVHKQKISYCIKGSGGKIYLRTLLVQGAHYILGPFGEDSDLRRWGQKLDMGKCCVHFESPEDLPLEAIGKLISAISSEKWIEMYEQSRLKTKAGQARAKQGASSASKAAASKVSAKRVNTKRWR